MNNLVFFHVDPSKFFIMLFLRYDLCNKICSVHSLSPFLFLNIAACQWQSASVISIASVRPRRQQLYAYFLKIRPVAAFTAPHAVWMRSKKEIVRRTIPFYLHFFGTQHRIKGPQHRQHILRADGFAAAQGDEGDQRRFFRRFRLNNIHILRF